MCNKSPDHAGAVCSQAANCDLHCRSKSKQFMPQSLSLVEARRIALHAQQFGSRPSPPRNVPALASIVRRLGLLQMDSVNVLVRAHYLPLFSRRGPYSVELLQRAAYDSRVLFEYWGHEASLIPVEWQPLFRWRMQQARDGTGTWGFLRRYASGHEDVVAAVLAQIRRQGPLAAGDLESGGRSSGGWWGWSQGKQIMEWLFWSGQVTTATRRNFERLYDLTERVLPAEVIAAATPAKEDAQRSLMKIAAAALGVATLRDLRDYFRLPTADAAARLQELIEEGAMVPVSVEGWKHSAYVPDRVRVPRAIESSALLSPFDSLIWERQRTERLFDFHYRIEIYTPAHKRQHGYYVLPLLWNERLAARVDLKSDRQRSRLQVRGGSVEEGIKVKQVVEPLAQQLRSMAQWLGLEGFEVTSRRGDLLKALRQARTQ
jgi:uncharacterized protein YcaQ